MCTHIFVYDMQACGGQRTRPGVIPQVPDILSVCLSLCMYVYLPACLSVYIIIYHHLSSYVAINLYLLKWSLTSLELTK